MMGALTLSVFTPSNVAILAGKATSGSSNWPLDGVLPLLTPEVRAWFANWYNNTRSVSLNALPSDQTVATAIERKCAEVTAERAQEHERAAAEAQELIADPARMIGQYGYASRWELRSRGMLDEKLEPELLAQLERARTTAHELCEQRNAEREAHALAQAEAAKAAELAKLAKRDEQRAAVRAFVLDHAGELPHALVRAATEKRDVTEAAAKVLQERVSAALISLVPEAHVKHWYDWEADDDRAPTDRAYAIRDAIVAGVDAIRAAALGANVTISDFGRADVHPRKRVWRTAVRVIVEHPAFSERDFGSEILCEELTLEEEDE